MGFSPYAAEIGVKWRANSEPDVAGYRLYWGPTSGVYTQSVVIGPELTNWSVLLPGGPQYLALTAFNTFGHESPISRELVYWPPLPPGEFEGLALWVITDSSCDSVFWEPAFTNAVAVIWPMEIFRTRMERVPLK